MAEIARPRAHGDKLHALRANPKLPASDLPRVNAAIQRYDAWRAELDSAEGAAADVLARHVACLNSYKRFVDLELIFCAEDDFLYRQNGQLKLSNSILEEFLPFLFDERLVPGLTRINSLICGPRASFAGLSFDAPYLALAEGAVQVELKDQDFAICKPYELKVKDPGSEDLFSAELVVSYFATEIKTNLDKTMFQEASQTASELKRAVPGAKYILLCEFLDMTPISTRLTAVDEVIVLRKSKRLASNVRANFSTRAGRIASKAAYERFLDTNFLHLSCFERLIEHIRECFPTVELSEAGALARGYF